MVLTQFFPPKPSFTERELPDLSDKVYIVTGANTGIGKELARILYSKNARVYLLTRSAEKANKAMSDIKEAVPISKGALVFIHLDLADLATIKTTAEKFVAVETKLHVLFNNAGVMSPNDKKLVTTPQGYEQHVSINVLGAFLLTQLLTPLLVSTAKVEPANTVRVVWLGSLASGILAEKNVGATPEMMQVDSLASKSGNMKYWLSKVGTWALGAEYAVRHKADGVISVSMNPGNLQSELYRNQGVALKLMMKLMMYPPVNGAYTELFGGLSPQITLENTGCWIIPFGRISPIRKDLELAIKTESDGGTGGTRRFWEWSEEQTRAYK